MVKMNLPSSDNQATSFGRVSASRMGAYESAMQALGSFIDATGLSGQAYKNAKDYAASTLLPLLKAAILYEESLSEAVKRLPSDYRATEYLEGKSLDSEDLEAELARLESVGMRLERSIDRALEMARDYPDYEWHAHSMMRQLHQVIDRKNKVRRQLQALLAFNERSSSFFSDIGDLETDLSQGISQVGSDMSNFSGSFPQRDITPEWVSGVREQWNARTAAIKALQGTDGLSEKEVQQLANYVALNASKEKEILVYDDLYGYAIYTISVETDNEGNVSLSVGEEGIESIRAGGVTASKDSLSSYAFVQGSAIGDIGTTYNTTLSRDGIPTASVKVGGENSSSQFITTLRNGRPAHALKTTTTASVGAITTSIAYEQGYYQRNNPNQPAPITVDAVDWGDVWDGATDVVGDIVDGVADFAQEHPILTGLAVVGAIGAGVWIAGGGAIVVSTAAAIKGLAVAGSAIATGLSMIYLGDENDD